MGTSRDQILESRGQASVDGHLDHVGGTVLRECEADGGAQQRRGWHEVAAALGGRT